MCLIIFSLLALVISHSQIFHPQPDLELTSDLTLFLLLAHFREQASQMCLLQYFLLFSESLLLFSDTVLQSGQNSVSF